MNNQTTISKTYFNNLRILAVLGAFYSAKVITNLFYPAIEMFF